MQPDPDVLRFADVIGQAPQISSVVQEARLSNVNPNDNFNPDFSDWKPPSVAQSHAPTPQYTPS